MIPSDKTVRVFSGCEKCFLGDYWDPASLCGECEARLEEEERQERFEAEYAYVDAATGHPI